VLENEKVFDITIIGGGPVGLFTAFYAGLRQASVKIIESLPQLGGQLAALYPEKYIYDVAGFSKITGQELVDRLMAQMSQFSPEVTLNEVVLKVEKDTNSKIFKVVTNKAIHYSKTIIITAGNGAFKPRKLELESADKFDGENLHYFITDMKKFQGKKVQIFGGGDSAVDWALMLEPIAKEVTIVHRRDKFRAHEHSMDLLQNSTVNVMTPFVPLELIGEKTIKQVVLEQVNGGEKKIFDVDDVIVNYGFVSFLGAIKDWGLEIEKNSIVVNSRMETNITGIYAAGDICTYEGKVRLIASGFGEAPTAVSNAKVYLDPSAKIQAPHSTTTMGEKVKPNTVILS